MGKITNFLGVLGWGIYIPLHTLALWIPERVIWLCGLIFLPFLIPFRVHNPNLTRPNGWSMVNLPIPNLPWDNYDDGLLGDREGNWCRMHSPETNFKKVEKFWPMFKYVGLRNPCHNLCKVWLYNCDMKRVKKVRVWGKPNVDSRIGEDGEVMSGWQIVVATGSWFYIRGGIYVVIPYNKAKCIRLRLGYKVTPRTRSDEKVTWTLSFSPYKSVIVGW